MQEAQIRWWAENTNPKNYQKRVATEPFKVIAKEIGDMDVLEVGCGASVWADNHNFFKLKGKYKGTDVVPEYVFESRKQFPEFEWDVQDANELTEPDKSWDVVLGIHVLEYTDGYEKPITEMCRVAKKKVIFVLWRGWIMGPDFIDAKPGGCSVYNKGKFYKFIYGLREWKVKVEDELVMDGSRFNYIWVLERRND